MRHAGALVALAGPQAHGRPHRHGVGDSRHWCGDRVAYLEPPPHMMPGFRQPHCTVHKIVHNYMSLHDDAAAAGAAGCVSLLLLDFCFGLLQQVARGWMARRDGTQQRGRPCVIWRHQLAFQQQLA